LGLPQLGNSGARRLVPWRQTLGARVLPRSNRRPVTHSSPPKRKLIERRLIAKAVLGVEKAPPLWESGAFRVMPLAEGFPSSAARQFGTPGFGSAWPERKAPPKRGKGLSWKENQDEATATITKIAAVLRLEVEVRKYLACRATNSNIRRLQPQHWNGY
jgi:hypothetical protein